VSSPEPRWEVPFPYGYTAAIDSMGSVSAPLLAAISVALATLVLSNAAAFHWVDPVLGLLISAAFALVASVQFTFRAKQFAVTPPDLEAWWPDSEDDPARLEMLRREQRYHGREYSKWAARARFAYNVGLLLFLLGVAATLIPKGGIDHASSGRLAVIALALLGLAIEALWIVSGYMRTASVRDWPAAPKT
jgi:hypothetical protein